MCRRLVLAWWLVVILAWVLWLLVLPVHRLDTLIHSNDTVYVFTILFILFHVQVAVPPSCSHMIGAVPGVAQVLYPQAAGQVSRTVYLFSHFNV